MIDAFEKNDMEAARKSQNKAMKMIRILKAAPSGFLSASKAVMKMIGLNCGPVRKPLRRITDEQYAQLEADLEATP